MEEEKNKIWIIKNHTMKYIQAFTCTKVLFQQTYYFACITYPYLYIVIWHIGYRDEWNQSGETDTHGVSYIGRWESTIHKVLINKLKL